MFIHQGVAVEKDPSLLEKKYDSDDMRLMMARLKVSYQEDPGRWTRIAESAQWRLHGDGSAECRHLYIKKCAMTDLRRRCRCPTVQLFLDIEGL